MTVWEIARLACAADAQRFQMIRMKGDAMSPTFNDGDLLVVDTDDKLPGNGIYIVCDGQGFVVRRVQYIPGPKPPRVRVSSDKDKCAAYECLVSHARIQGRIVGGWVRQ